MVHPSAIFVPDFKIYLIKYIKTIMEEKELKEIFDLLEKQGMRPQLCDTPVPVSGSTAHCGDPTEIGDESIDDYILIPKSLVGQNPEMYVPAVGDSMIDAGVEEGDLLRVRFGVAAHDGDKVLVMIDGACTVKVLYSDEDDTKWLVPRNDKYDAIELTEDMDVRMLGVVVGIEKVAPRDPSRPLMQSIRRTKNKKRAAKKLSEEEVNQLIVRISTEIQIARQWFSVYRAMVDHGVLTAGDFAGFCNRVKSLLPESTKLPDAKDLSRFEIGSFAKPIALWAENNAPVSGARFNEYKRIALLMGTYLTEKM